VDTPRLLAGRYRLIAPADSGGTSVVWLALDERLNRRVGVRLLAASFAADGAYRDRIAAEVRASAMLSHPNLTPILDHGETDEGEPFVVLDLIDGTPLAAVLAEGAMPWRLAVEACSEVAAALSATHASGLAHRDLTPATILMTDDGARLVDFGSSAVVDEGAAGAPEALVIGTPHYLAPERLAGKTGGPAVDVYALGVVLYQALTGALPWRVPVIEGAAEPALPVVPAADREPVPLPPIPGLPAEVAELCLRCLRADPAARPSAARLARRLARNVRLKTVVVDPATEADEAPVAALATGTPVPGQTGTPVPAPLRAAAHRREPVVAAPAVVAKEADVALVSLGSVVVTDPSEGDERDGGAVGLTDPRNRRLVALVGALTLAVLLVGALGAFVFRPDDRARPVAGIVEPTATVSADAAAESPIVSPDAGSLTASAQMTLSVAAPTLVRSSAAPVRPPGPSATTVARPSPPPPCAVRLEVNQWAEGANVMLQITNTGSRALDGWTLAFKMTGGLQLGSGWNGIWNQSGEIVTVRNAAHNGEVDPGTSVQIGAGVSGTGDKRSKISNAFAVNGSPCDSR
jgi:hypothetical protein